MRRSSLKSITKISIIISFFFLSIIFTLFLPNNINAQFFLPTSGDYLSFYAMQQLFSPVPQYPIGIPLQASFNNPFALQTANTGFYPNATYFGAPAGAVNPATAGRYITNATGYYTIEESDSCTCNLP